MTGERHPDVPLRPGLDAKRLWLAAFALFMLIVTLAPTPIGSTDANDGTSLSQIVEKYHKDHPSQSNPPPSKK